MVVALRVISIVSDEYMMLVYREIEYMMNCSLIWSTGGFVYLASGTLQYLQTLVRGEGAQNCSVHISTQLYYTM